MTSEQEDRMRYLRAMIPELAAIKRAYEVELAALEAKCSRSGK